MRLTTHNCLESQLIALVANSANLTRALHAGKNLALSSWCIGAGAVRNVVWDHLHGFAVDTPAQDIDLVFFDDANLSPELEQQLERKLARAEPGFNWDVVNQAGVHRWINPHAVQAAPFQSLQEGVASWPEVATCVGVTLNNAGKLEVIAPHGLDDLFEMVIRWNPGRVSSAVFAERVATKRFAERWPRVTVLAG